MPKPEPVAVVVVCSLCDEPWGAHGDKPTTEDCIRLLKAKLVPYVQPTYVQPTPNPYWWGQTICQGNTSYVSGFTTNGTAITYRRPDDGPTPVAA